MVPCFSKNGIGVHTAEISLILCQNYAMCHVCLWFMKKWLKICKNFNSQHWKSFFWLNYSLDKNFTKARPWGLRPCSKRVPKSTNLWTTPPIYELGRYLPPSEARCMYVCIIVVNIISMVNRTYSQSTEIFSMFQMTNDMTSCVINSETVN